MSSEFKEIIEKYVDEFKGVEDAFADLIRKINGDNVFVKVSKKNSYEDMVEHWDVLVIFNEKITRYDVKGLKKFYRGDTYPCEKIHFIEWVNVNGDPGWLYAGIPDFIVFETEKQWVIVNRKRLQKFMEEKCPVKIYCKNPTLYQFYTREKRKDEIVMVETDELKKIATKILDK